MGFLLCPPLLALLTKMKLEKDVSAVIVRIIFLDYEDSIKKDLKKGRLVIDLLIFL